ncbi:C39 family peptidase [Streptomyces albidoflavus]|uniref:C39 family peptidase n=1 Tax=Streptomyces TaxID=1883 RepID=UPI0006792D9F|nr:MULTISPECIES: C39 family peptidase [Streptomyces]QXQ25881.1 C39 family peptidase [Streptomyces albidoflavus]QXQ31810.1 C39 family peptidase [Streptomyces albidoflavus]
MSPPTVHPVPYYSQWESASLVPDFISGRTPATEDPLWQKSGADSPEEYGYWAPRMCGVACLRMALDHWGHQVPPSIPLVRDLCEAGAYVREGDSVKGLIYRPFTEYVQARWGLTAEVRPNLPPAELPEILHGGRLALLSVHKTIRTPHVEPPSRGGHLVLAVGANKEAVLVNNPSGLPGSSQTAAAVPWARLDAFYAHRGVILGD